MIYFIEHGYNYVDDVYNLLYCFDVQHYKETIGIKALNIDWYANSFGPDPVQLNFNLINVKQDFVKLDWLDVNFNFIALKKFDDTYFSKRQLKILEYFVKNYIPYDKYVKTDMYDTCIIARRCEPVALKYHPYNMYKITDDIWNQWCGFTCEQMLDIEENNNDKKILEEIFKNG